MRIRIGTRASALAMAQARLAAQALRQKGVEAELVLISTRGDEDAASPLAALGRGAFTSALSRALAAGEIDLAVHSAKDLPEGEAYDGFYCLPRGDARDALVSAAGREPVRIGTSSLRRAQAMARLFPAAQVLPVRGNIDTRLAKLFAGGYDALVLAAAGLSRLGFADARAAVTFLSPAQCVPAACQGILALEGEAGALVDDAAARRAADIERAMQRALGGGCTGGAGAYFDGNTLFAQKGGRIRSLRYEGAGSIARLAEELQ